MFLVADNSGDTLNKKFFIIFIILFFILILSGFNIVNASDDYGISTTALITDSSVDDDNNITVSFTCNFPDEIIEKTFILSSEFRSSLDNYMIVYSYGNLHLLDTSETNAIIWPYAKNLNVGSLNYYTCNTSFTEVKKFNNSYTYNFSSNEWVADSSVLQSDFYGYSPSCFVYASGLAVYFYYANNYGYSGISNYLCQTPPVSIYAAQFDIDSPYLVSFKDNVLTFALQTFYPDYSWSDETVTEGINNIELLSYDDFYLYIYNAYNEINSIVLSYSDLKNHIVDVDGVGKCIQLDLDNIDSFDFKDDDYFFEFGFTGTFQANVAFSGGQNFSYKSMYSFLIEDGITKNVDIGGNIENDEDDKYNKLTNSIIESNQEQTNAIKENTETNKGIWETIKEILSYLSPFSENFFVYKLINLLVDALKSLFIPSDDFFINWFSELNDIFSKQFGFLYYPFSVIFTFLGDLDNVLVTTEPIINVPAFEFNFFSKNVNIWDSFSYNFNDLLLIDSVKKLHTFYILFVDIIFTIGILYYARKVFIKIFK